MNLSKRLTAVASLITKGNSVADIGTDHGYIPIYMAQKGYTDKAFAMDVNEGPLQRAVDNIARYNVSDKVGTRLSDGLKGLSEGEADTIVIAGMGGLLTIRILTDGAEVAHSAKELILSPHSDVHLVRAYLAENEYVIIDETMVEEDGKFYFVMKVENGHMDITEDIHMLYGKHLLMQKNPTLKDYLLKEEAKRITIKEKMTSQGSTNEERMMELDSELRVIRKALETYES